MSRSLISFFTAERSGGGWNKNGIPFHHHHGRLCACNERIHQGEKAANVTVVTRFQAIFIAWNERCGSFLRLSSKQMDNVSIHRSNKTA